MEAVRRHRESAPGPWGWLRQRRFPVEFRIEHPLHDGGAGPATAGPVTEPAPHAADPPHPADPANPAHLVDPVDPADPADPGDDVAGASTDLPDEVVADVVTEIWRARRKVDGSDAEHDAHRAVRWASRHLSAAASRLTAAGIETHDHDGLRFDVGMELRVLAYQDDPGVTAETVVETVRPSVRRAGRVVQEGEVIVAVPEQAVPEQAAPAQAAPEQQEQPASRRAMGA